MIRTFVNKNRSNITQTVVFTFLGVCAFNLGVWVKDLQRFMVAYSWRTPRFLGNSGRSPIYPFRPMPWYEEREKFIDFWRKEAVIEFEFVTAYRLKQFQNFFHP